MSYLSIFAFLSVPVIAIIYFIISLVRYQSAKKKNKQTPDTYNKEEIKTRKKHLIISSCVAGILFAIIIAFVCLFFIGIAYM